MIYTTKRFSYALIEGVNKGGEYIGAQVDSGVSAVHDISSKITEDPRLKDVKPVKRYGGFVRNLSYLLKKRKKKNKHNNQ